MEQVSDELLKLLLNARENPAVSIFLPTFEDTSKADQNPIRFKNLLKSAKNTVGVNGGKNKALEDHFDRAAALLDDKPFWQNQSKGLAVFFSPHTFELVKLPFAIDEKVMVSDHFSLRSILPAFKKNRVFFILAVSQNDVRCLEATPGGVKKVIIDDCPGSLEEALQYDDPQKNLQFRSIPSAAPHTSNRASGSAMFHGHGASADTGHEDLHRFAQMVMKKVDAFMGEKQTPLVLAGADRVTSAFRQSSNYKRIVPGSLEGNPDRLRDDELGVKAWPLVKAVFRKDLDGKLKAYEELIGTEKVSTNIGFIIDAAVQGKIDTLFIDKDAHIWGIADENTGQSTIHPVQDEDDRELLEFATTKTIAQGGNVYELAAEEMPEHAAVAAMFRF